MGTSASSAGPGPKVPFDPPWLGDQESESLGDSDTAPEEQGDDPAPSKDEPSAANDDNSLPDLAPQRRFDQARRNIGSYAKEGGGRDSFQKAAGQYSHTGMGGSGRLAGRMQASATTGARAATFLQGVSSRSDTETKRWVDEITSRDLSNQQIIDLIVDQVAPLGGSRDEESCSHSMAQAMSEFLEENENSGLLDLKVAEIRDITERFMANEAYNRLINDIGQVFESQKLSPRETYERCEEMREYLREDISVQIKAIWTENSNPSQQRLSTLLTTAIEKTFHIYESDSE